VTCRVVLVGMMGSGKTSVGRRLSELTGWPLHDNDDLLQRLFDATPREILARHGEPRLRAAESAALAVALAAPAPSIVGAAAGTILDDENRERLDQLRRPEGAVVVWLQANPASLAARSMDAEHRPWLDTGGSAWIDTAAVERAPLYASVADLAIDTDGRSAEAVADQLLESLATVDACREAL
jgi:shikimate kinase